jgi:hypothetical protein
VSKCPSTLGEPERSRFTTAEVQRLNDGARVLPGQRGRGAGDALFARAAASGDADARLALSPASPPSIIGEYLTDRLALYDYARKAHVATWRRISAALEVA